MEEIRNGLKDKMVERLLELAVRIMKLETQLCQTYSGRHIYGQLFRSGSSAGANFEESIGAESRADFIHKTQIVLKELREANYWLRLIRKSQLIDENNVELKYLVQESEEFKKIFSKSLVTAKKIKNNAL